MHPAILLLILGTSMEPTLHNGSRHLETFPPYATLHVGDVVNYRNDFIHTPVVHRIVGGWAGKWITRGDHNSTVDRGYLTPHNYIGEVLIPCATHGS